MIKLLVGCPGSGKTSYAHDAEQACKIIGNITYKHISRDMIRFSLVKETEYYFSKEKEVFNLFVKEIQEAIDNRIDMIVIDATHISVSSRKKLLSRINIPENYIFEAVVFDIPLDVLKKRNGLRAGRARVPETAMENMFYDFSEPTYEELEKLVPNAEEIRFMHITEE